MTTPPEEEGTPRLAGLGALRQRASRVIAVARALYYPVAIALVAYLAYRAARDTDLASLHYWALAAAFPLALVWWVCLARGWAALVDDGSPGVVQAAFGSWCRTQVARYLPGGIWAVVARATTVQGRARDKVAAVTAENVVVLLVALSIGAAWAGVHDPRWLPLVLLLVAPVVGFRWLERRTQVQRRQVRGAAAWYAVGYVAYGAAGLLTQLAVSGVRSPTHPLYVAGASCVAWAVGLVVVFAPSGVGVRELVYVWMLSGLYPRAELTAAAVTSRLVTVLAELTVLAAVAVASRRRARTGAAAAATTAPTRPSDD